MAINKKVLIISHNSFSKVFNNGKTLESIFSGFDKENLAQLFFSENEYPDLEFCDNYYKMTDTSVLKGFITGYQDFGEVICAGNVLTNTLRTNTAQTILNKQSKVFKFLKSHASKLLVFRDLLWSINSWKTKSLFFWIQKFEPNIIFYVGGDSGFSHEIAVFLSKKYQISLVTYFTDDYLIYPENKNFLEYIQRKRIKKFYQKTIQHSTLCFAIGEIMSVEYTKYFKKSFLPIMNSIEVQEYIPYISNSTVQFSYFGGLHLNRWEMLVKLASLVSNATINVYTIEKPSEDILNQFKKAKINYNGSLEGENLKKAIQNSDILLHVESNNSYYKSLTKLSISTKIPEYLMSGRFILGFGPEDVASMKILSNNKIGTVISSNLEDNLIKTQLDNIVNDANLRNKIGKKGYDFAVKHFDNKITANAFKQNISNIN